MRRTSDSGSASQARRAGRGAARPHLTYPPADRARRELARDGHNDKQINTTKQTDGAAGFTACITACNAERKAFDRREGFPLSTMPKPT